MERDEFIKFICGKRKCKESTGRVNFFNIRRVRKMLGESDLIPQNASWLPKKTDWAEELSQVQGRNLFSSIVAFLKAVDAPEDLVKTYSKKMKEFSIGVDKIYLTQKRTEKQKKNWLNHKKVVEFYKEQLKIVNDRGLFKKKEWSKREQRLAENLLILSFHVEDPPRLEFAQLIFTKKQSQVHNEANWVFRIPRKGWHALIYVGKTITDNRPRLIHLNKYTQRILNHWSPDHLQHQKPVFPDKSGQPISRNAYSKRLGNMFESRFGKVVTASLLRNIFISDRLKGLPALKALHKSSHNMMHSLDTAMNKYNKKL